MEFTLPSLRSGTEHRQLRHKPCQIQVMDAEGDRPYLEYPEDVSKNHPRELKHRKTMPKIVQHYGNPDNPDRCFVCLFKLYNSVQQTGQTMPFICHPYQIPNQLVGTHMLLLDTDNTKLRNAVADMCK